MDFRENNVGLMALRICNYTGTYRKFAIEETSCVAMTLMCRCMDLVLVYDVFYKKVNPCEIQVP